MVTFTGVDDSSYITNRLSNLSPEQFVSTAELLDQNKSSTFMKKYEQILLEGQENEYNRTQPEDRSDSETPLQKLIEKKQFKLNKNNSPRLLETFDSKSMSSRDSYLNLKLRENPNRTFFVTPSMSSNGTLGIEARGQS